MRFALCNEVFDDRPLAEGFARARDLGYAGIEIAPHTLLPADGPPDVRDIPSEQRAQVRRHAADLGLEVVGLHWLFHRTRGLGLTSADPAIQRATASYLGALAELCHDLGGRVMVLGSPQQRQLAPGDLHAEGMERAAQVLRWAAPKLVDFDVTLAIEPLGPAEVNFLNTANSAVELARLVDSPCCRLHLDMKGMASERAPASELIHQHAAWLAHFHANDANLLGPGMGDAPLGPVVDALRAIDYRGWVSVEPMRYEPSRDEVARRSIENLRGCLVGA